MLEFLMREANKTYTENGAVSNRSTGKDCLDLFATIGALRRESEREIVDRFLRAYTEDADLAMKILFFARDVRGGLGERRVFRTVAKWLAENEKKSLVRNLPFIADRHDSEEMFTFRRQIETQVLLRFIVCKIIQRHAEYISQESAFVQIRHCFS